MRRHKVKAPVKDLVSLAIDAELIRRDSEGLPRDFKAFIREAWDKTEQYAFKNGYHIEAIAEHLQACAQRDIKTLVINVPPRHGKSTLGSVMLPAWVLARNPGETLLYASYSEKLATRDSVKTRRLIESDWYRTRFPHVAIEDDSNLKTAFITTAKGGRQCTSVGGTVTGMGGSWLVIDDPVNVKDAESAVVRETANQFFLESWYNRIEGDPNNAVRIVIMQRVHAQDVSAICHDLGWDSLVLPMEFESHSKPTSIGWVDPRSTFGDLLWPEMWTEEAVEKQKKAMGSFAYAGQYQQRPVPRGGGVFKKEWLRFWFDPLVIPDPPPVPIQTADGQFFDAPMKRWTPPERDYTNSWDMAFKGGATSDFVVGQAWVRDGGFYLVDQERGRYDFPATVSAVQRLHSRRPAMPTLVEGKANGSAVVSALSSEIPGMIEVTPEGGKEARAAAVAPLFEAGNVWLPHPAMAPWVQEYIDELCVFPRGVNDDQVDATTQALVRLREKATVAIDLGSTFGGRVEIGDGLVEASYWDSVN